MRGIPAPTWRIGPQVRRDRRLETACLEPAQKTVHSTDEASASASSPWPSPAQRCEPKEHGHGDPVAGPRNCTQAVEHGMACGLPYPTLAPSPSLPSGHRRSSAIYIPLELRSPCQRTCQRTMRAGLSRLNCLHCCLLCLYPLQPNKEEASAPSTRALACCQRCTPTVATCAHPSSLRYCAMAPHLCQMEHDAKWPSVLVAASRWSVPG